jgi:hypothetical protein
MTRRRPPMLVSFLIRHAMIGFAVAAVAILGILFADPAGLGRLLVGAGSHPGPALLLWFFLGLTFGSAQIAFAVTHLAVPEDRGPPGGRPVPRFSPVPVPVRVRR